MDPAQVVAVAVLPDRLVVFSMQRDHGGDLALGPDSVAGRPAAREWLDVGRHDNLSGRAHLGEPVGQAERVAHDHRERAERMPAAQV